MAEERGEPPPFYLHTSPGRFFITRANFKGKILVIERTFPYDLRLEDNIGQIPTIAIRKPIAGLIGIITLVSGRHLVVVTRKARIGKVCGGDIWRVVETKIISFARAEHYLTPSQLAENRRYTAMLQQVLSTPSFYFSYTTDLSHTRQREHSLRSGEDLEFQQKSMLGRCCQRFVWNFFLLDQFRRSSSETHQFVLLLCHGFMATEEVHVAGLPLTVSVLARRSTERAGTRLNVRGASPNGQVANLVETEQVVEVLRSVASFAQLRGSMPLLWSQRPNLVPDPDPVLDVDAEDEDHVAAFNAHVIRLEELGYREQLVLVNLVDHHSSEGRLQTKLSDTVATVRENNEHVHYEPFDFHHECRQSYDRLNILLNRLNQEQYGFFLESRLDRMRQTGVLRTNCVDSLDRTNVVQSLIGRRNLHAVLVRLGVIQEHMTLGNQADKRIRSMWVRHGNLLSEQHSGSGAVYSEVTETSARSIWGRMDDWRRCFQRHIQNNFFDGWVQDSLDLLVGNYPVVEGTPETPLAGGSRWWRMMMTRVFAVLGILVIFSFFLLPSWIPLSALGCGIGVYILLLFLLGPDCPMLVPWPELQ